MNRSNDDMRNERSAQITNWEAHLASIIEKTSRNIEELSQTPSHGTINGFQNNTIPPSLPQPPPPPHNMSFVQINNSSLRSTTPLTVGDEYESSLHSTVRQSSLVEAQHHNHHHVITSDGNGGGVTRPIPKHVEEDLTKRIEQSIRKSIEKILYEKFQSNQERIEDLNERFESLSTDLSKVLQERDTFSRTLSMQDRLSRRLKAEWESQKVALSRVESIINEEKQATKEEIDLLVQRHTNELSTRLTIPQFQSAVVSLSTKTKSAVEKTALSLQNSYQSDISLVKNELKALRESQEELRCDLHLNKVKCDTMLSTFDEGRVKDIVGAALQSHFQTLEANTTSKVQSLLQSDMQKRVEECVQNTVKKNLEECLSFGDNEDSNSLFQKFVMMIKIVLEENKGNYIEPIVKTKVEQILDRRETEEPCYLSSLKTEVSKLLTRVECLEKMKLDQSALLLSEKTQLQQEPSDDQSKKIERIVEQCVQKQYNLLQGQCEAMIMHSRNNVVSSVEDVQNSLDSVEKALGEKIELVENRVKTYTDDSISRSEVKVIDCKQQIDELANSNAIISSKIGSALDMKGNVGILSSQCDDLTSKIDSLRVTQSNEMAHFHEVTKKMNNEYTDVNNVLNKTMLNHEKTKESMNDIQHKMTSFDKKVSTLEVTVFDTIQSMNALQLELSKARDLQQHGGNSSQLEKENFESMVCECVTKLSELEKKFLSDFTAVKEEIARIEASVVHMNSDTSSRIDYQIQGLKNDISTYDNTSDLEAKFTQIIESQQKTTNDRIDSRLEALKNQTKDTEKKVDEMQNAFLSIQDEIHDMNANVKKMREENDGKIDMLHTKFYHIEEQLMDEVKPNRTHRNDPSSHSITNVFDCNLNDKSTTIGSYKESTKSNNENNGVVLQKIREDDEAQPNKSKESNQVEFQNDAFYFEYDSVSGKISTYDEEFVVPQKKDNESDKIIMADEPDIPVSFDLDDVQSLGQISSFDEDESICIEGEEKSNTPSDYESDFDSDKET